jgi:hypothetical protein
MAIASYSRPNVLYHLRNIWLRKTFRNYRVNYWNFVKKGTWHELHVLILSKSLKGTSLILWKIQRGRRYHESTCACSLEPNLTDLNSSRRITQDVRKQNFTKIFPVGASFSSQIKQNIVLYCDHTQICIQIYPCSHTYQLFICFISIDPSRPFLFPFLFLCYDLYILSTQH